LIDSIEIFNRAQIQRVSHQKKDNSIEPKIVKIYGVYDIGGLPS